MYKTNIKEPHYFAPIGESFYKKRQNSRNYFFEEKISIAGLKNYAKIYKDSPDGKMLIDGSTHYFFQNHIFIEKINEIYKKKRGDVKIIISLRNPVDRCFSAFNYLKKIGIINNEESFDKFIKKPSYLKKNLIGMSLYAEGIEKLYKNFKRENILIIKYEEIDKKKDLVVDEMGLFFGEKLRGNIPLSNVTIFNSSGWQKIFHINTKIILFGKKNYLLGKMVAFMKPVNNAIKLMAIKIHNYGSNKINKTTREFLLNDYFRSDIFNLIKITGDDYFSIWLKK